MSRKNYANVILPLKGRGYFGIGIEAVRSTKNIGTIWRSAQIMGADFIFIVGKRYETMKTDTMKSWKHIPLFEYENFAQFQLSIPKAATLIGVELAAESKSLIGYKHPERAIYLLGSESIGLSAEAQSHCHELVQLPGEFSLNVSVAASIVLYDRVLKSGNFKENHHAV